MDTIESLGYLKGLIDGLDLEADKKETKVIKAMLDVIEKIVDDVDAAAEAIEILGEQVDDIDADLEELEDYVYDDDDDDDDDWDEDDDDEYVEFEVECPACGEEITVDEDTVMEGKFECPNCGEVLEFEFDDDECDDEDCDCHHE